MNDSDRSAPRQPRGDDPPELVALFTRYRATGDRALRDELVQVHMSIAQACARRFTDRGEPFDDLFQVALLGLVKAVDRFDPERGVPFAGFALPTITGELRRHFRDATWSVYVPRRTKDLHVRMASTIERLTSQLGRSPTTEELSNDLGVTVDEVLAALDAGAAYRSSEMSVGAEAELSASSEELHPGFDRAVISELFRRLGPTAQQVVYLRFFEDLSQSEIADAVGTTQVQVSRILRRSLRDLRVLGGERS